MLNRDTLRANARILIADDVEINRALIGALYRAEGFTQVKEASNGQEVMDLIEAWHPDLLVLDLMMPVMDGAEVCKRLQENPGEEPPVVIIQTALEDPHHKGQLFELGASDYVVKPVERRELMLRSYVHLEKRAMMASLKEYNENMKEELVHAAAVQQELLPSESMMKELSARYGMDLAALHQSSIAIGGDIWGIKPINDHCFALFIVDIAGHGVKAALGAARIDVLIRGLEPSGDPAAFLSALNVRLHHMLTRGSYATMICAVIDTKAKELRYATAGAHPPLVLDGTGHVYHLPASGLPLGIELSATYDTHTIAFKSGARCLLYSDAMVESKPWLGIDNVAEVLKSKHAHAQEMIHELQSMLFSENENLSLDDDLTLVALIAK
jgi:phosphoserine phosphatase RsbU/P